MVAIARVLQHTAHGQHVKTELEADTKTWQIIETSQAGT